MRIRTESEGTADSDEPARLWTYLATTGAPMQELLTGDYSVAADFSKVPRPSVHGKTGVLTMKGFIQNKPGLPHYNYAARVMTDFMGSIFEVPSEVFDMRGAATAASTVDPTSICFSCHQLLTPLAHQRLSGTTTAPTAPRTSRAAPSTTAIAGWCPRTLSRARACRPSRARR